MDFRITGRITEKESGLGVPNLILRAYDKDLLYDDLLGSAISDADGQFEMIYTEKDFQELFEKKPDIYLVVYAPPLRKLMDTEAGVRWGAHEHEHFDLVIDRKILGNQAPSLPDDTVQGGLALAREALRIDKRAGFDLPRLPRFATGGAPGEPALPEQVRYIALPLGGDVLELEVIAGEAVRLPGPVNPFPVQEAVPDVGTDPNQFGDGFSADNINIEFTPPNPRLYEVPPAKEQELVQLLKVEEVGAIQFAAVRVRPLQYDPQDKTYIFYPDLRYNLKFDLEKARKTGEHRKRQETRIGPEYAELVTTLLESELVVAAKDLFFPVIVYFLEDAPHVILTDNYAWPTSAVDRGDGTTRAPTLTERGAALSGDMVAEFERLAMWKSAKGVRSRVVTISDIVSGKYGDFTQGGFARDLQEVLRNFIKIIAKNWDTLYLLLGGDVNVVPMRGLVGASTYKTIGCSRIGDNPPPEKRCHVISGKSAVKIHPLFQPATNNPLSSMHGGLRIPFDREAGSGRLGWYFTSEADFTTKNEGFTRLPAGQSSKFVIVEGPQAVIDDDYYWLRDVNTIPSDFYYASLIGSGYSNPGKHDFDLNNNELYGQYHWDATLHQEVSLDGLDYWPDVFVGRASVESGDQARFFVDKVLTYERLETPDGEMQVDTTYLQKVLYAADYWGRKWQYRQMDTSIPPAEGKFTHAGGTTLTKVRTEFDLTLSAGVPSHRLVGRKSAADVVVPYNTSANAANLGWFFATSDSYTTQSATPTRFIKVLGPEADVNPDSFFWDPMGLELAISEKETLRGLMNGWYPGFTSVDRHYSDYFDLSAPPPIQPLVSANVLAAMDNGVHFASLSGHGSPGGCCGVSSSHDFTNDNKYFIAFANSCSTARPDGYDSLGEKSIFDQDGGAIGYVGNTRYGWIGVGDNFEEFFWSKLRASKRMGVAAGLRLATGGIKSMWTFYTQTLFGDPEMPVWTSIPGMQQVTHPSSVAWGGAVNVTVRVLGSPVSGHRVTLMGGWINSASRPTVLLTKNTNSFGQASFTLPSSGSKPSQVLVTVTRNNFKPYQGTVQIT